MDATTTVHGARAAANDPKNFKSFAEFYPFYSLMGDGAMHRDIWLGKVKIS